MGIGYRVFFLDDNDSIESFPRARYERLLRGEPGEQLSRYAGKRVRCAFVILDVDGQLPLSIRDVTYSWLALDAEGRVDPGKRKKQMKLAMELMSPLNKTDHPHQIIDARSQFAKKRYEHEFQWAPTPDIQAAIVSAIFGKGPA